MSRIGKNPVQHAQLALIRLRALKQLAQAQHDRGGLTPLVELDVVQHLRQMHVKLLHLRRISGRFVAHGC